jgi:hypothetical protein
MRGQRFAIGYRAAAIALLSVVLLGQAVAQTSRAQASESPLGERRLTGVQLDHLTLGYRPGGTLGFSLRDTAIDEQLYRRVYADEREVLWSAGFVSQWPLNEDQLDRWSAQVGGLVVDSIGPNVRLAGWERLQANDIGDQRIAYRYMLADANGRRLGEATIVVFARGNEVGITAAAAVGTQAPLDATGLARLLDAGPSGL